jgi:hypothetical protein
MDFGADDERAACLRGGAVKAAISHKFGNTEDRVIGCRTAVQGCAEEMTGLADLGRQGGEGLGPGELGCGSGLVHTAVFLGLPAGLAAAG